jgi:hypothetical protein
MADNKNKQGWQDDIQIDKNDPSEVERLHKKFPKKSHQEIKDAIAKKGPYRKDVEAYLNSN